MRLFSLLFLGSFAKEYKVDVKVDYKTCKIEWKNLFGITDFVPKTFTYMKQNSVTLVYNRIDNK